MGVRFTEAVIQQHGLLDRKCLPILKDFAHLMNDLSPVQENGYYVFSVPELKLSKMSHTSYRTVSRVLRELNKKKILVCLSREDVAANKVKKYGLKLPNGFDIEKLKAPNFGNVFGGRSWEEISAEYDARKGSIKKRQKKPGECLAPVRTADVQTQASVDKLSTLQQSTTNNIYNTKESDAVVDNSDKKPPMLDDVQALMHDIAMSCPGFDCSVKECREIADWEMPHWRNALAVFKLEKSRKEENGEAMENEGAYLLFLVRRAKAGKLKMPNLTDAEGKIVEPIGNAYDMTRWIWARYGLWDLGTRRPLVDMMKLAELDKKLKPIVKGRKQSEVTRWCEEFDKTLGSGKLLTPADKCQLLLDYLPDPA